MSRLVIKRFLEAYAGRTDTELKELALRAETTDLKGVNHMLFSYLFNRLNGYRPRLSLLRNSGQYGGHELQAPTQYVAKMLKLRAEKRLKNPRFIRYMLHQQRMSPSYRREKGLHNKRRREIYGRGFNVKMGYRTPAICRHHGPLGYAEKLVTDMNSFAQINGFNTVVRLAHVGLRLKLKLEHEARRRRLWVVNGYKWLKND